MWVDLGKIIELLPKVKKIAQSGHTEDKVCFRSIDERWDAWSV